MSIDARQQVDVRFFGAHDRAWVPAAHCMLFSEKDPNKTKGSTPTNNKNASKTQKGIADAMKEKDDYIVNLREKFGFKYATFRQPLDPSNLQGQLDFMLPGLNNTKDSSSKSGEKEAEGGQKEKLTLKIIKGSASNYQVEQKSAEIRTPTIQKDKPKVYKVMSKDNTDTEQTGNKLSLIIKRKSNVEQEVEKAKRSKVNDTASETSESNASVQSGKLSRRKATRDLPKHRKSLPEPAPKRGKHTERQKSLIEDGDAAVDEVARIKAMKRARTKSILPESDKPLLVPLVVPAGTDEIQPLKEVSNSPPIVKRINSRSHSYHRSRSVDRDSIKDVKVARLSISSPLKRSLSEHKDASRKNSVHEDKNEVKEKEKEEGQFDPNLVIKDEPMSDGEEVMQRDTLTLSDIPDLMQDKSGKKKLIVISTTDRNAEPKSAASLQNGGRARKTFPNHPNQRQIDSLASQISRNGEWMVCIPQALGLQASSSSTMQSPPTSNRSTPASESQVSVSQVRSNPSSSRGTPNVLPAVSISSATSSNSNRSTSQSVSLSSYTNMAGPSSVQRHDSIHTNPMYMNGQRISMCGNNQQRQTNAVENPPKLAPRPQGVFVNDGTVFSRDIGPVSRMFTDNAHRMSDYFRNLLIDTVASFAPDVPTAENLMLRAENEKLHREMQTTKSDCQLKMQELRREHQDEIDSVRKANGETLNLIFNLILNQPLSDEVIAALRMTFEQDKARLVSEIRQQSEVEKQRAIDITRKETKKTTWCSNCTKEARFYCCWNTSYCGPQCQKTHWAIHQKYCTNVGYH